ncbi:DNA-binding response regulator [Pontibacter sp. SGAir0037]|uniref:response regulator transcription factor n=1 Tax=Pontibacter sp. SGAir0037 TaxID=2571030 RepID=UPI00143D7179|nr:DNA-binding response regulator [Pontibacter sp. SGAir0037]
MIIEDERLVAEHVASVLKQAQYEHVVIANNRKDAMQLYRQQGVDLIISDINLYGQHEGPLIIRELLAIRPAPVVYLTAYSEQQTLDDALLTAPAAYVLKPFTERQLLVAVKMALRQTEAVTPGNEPKPSARELDIIQYLAEGMSSKKIAEKLFISEYTVNTHRRNILRKFDVGTSSELIAMAVKQRWIKLL